MACTITKEQYRALEGLAYHRADYAYMREKYGTGEPELLKVDDNIRYAMQECDALGIPFIVQNAVLAWAEEWRSTLREYAYNALARRGICLN